jgi:hypothetical protein
MQSSAWPMKRRQLFAAIARHRSAEVHGAAEQPALCGGSAARSHSAAAGTIIAGRRSCSTRRQRIKKCDGDRSREHLLPGTASRSWRCCDSCADERCRSGVGGRGARGQSSELPNAKTCTQRQALVKGGLHSRLKCRGFFFPWCSSKNTKNSRTCSTLHFRRSLGLSCNALESCCALGLRRVNGKRKRRLPSGSRPGPSPFR